MKDNCSVQPTTQERVGQSDWVVIVRGFACGFGIGGGTDIIAVNQKTSKTVTLAAGDDVYRSSLVSQKDGSLTIVTPNRSDISMYSVNVPGVRFVYTPVDDPADCEHYKQWVKDNRNSANRVWYCDHVFAEFPDETKKLLNKTIPYGLDSAKDADHHFLYCPADLPLP